MATTMSARWVRFGWAKVAPMASSIPAAPTRFPARARFGDDSPFRARMKPMTATR